MKKLSILAAFALLVTLLGTSCESDIGGGGVLTTPPSVSLISGTGYVSSDATINAGDDFTVQLSASAGSEDLSSLAIYENDVLIPNSRISIFGGSSGTGNPIPINSTDANGFTWDIAITGHSTAEVKTYRFTVVDIAGGSDSRSILIDATPATTFDFVLRTDAGCVSSDLTDVVAGTLLKVCPVGTRGPSAPLSKISVFEDGSSITDLNRLRFGTVNDNFTTNPYDLPSEFESVLDTVIYIQAHNSGTKTYTIVLEDAAGNALSQTFDITIEVTGTPVTSLSGALYNSGGPTGTGGIDLDTGNGTGSSDASAELRDLGTAASWAMQFAPISGNNANLRSVSVDYNAVSFVEEIVTAYDGGTTISSATASVGDVYAIERDGAYYLIKVTGVNEDTSGNDDNITFDIKK